MGAKSKRASRSQKAIANRTTQSNTSEKISCYELDPRYLRYIECVVFAVSLMIYVLTTYPSIPGGDSGELVTAACELGVAHPPGYPLWTMMSAAAIWLLPFRPAYSVNLLTCLISALTSTVLFKLCYLLTRNVTGSLTAVCIFSLSPLVWTWSITAEVFSLNNLLITLLLYTLYLFESSDTSSKMRQTVAWGSFLCGFSLSNQHTAILYIIVIVPRVLYHLHKQQELSVNVCCVAALSGIAGLLPYFYLPVSGYLNWARWSWGTHTDLSGLLTHILRMEYGTFDLGRDQVGAGFLSNLYSYKMSVVQELSPLGYALCCLGLVQIYTDTQTGVRRFGQLCLVMLAVYISFFCWRANLDVSSPLLRGVVERFWLQTLIVWAVLISLGYKLFHVRLELRWMIPTWAKAAFVVAIFSAFLARSYPVCNRGSDTVVNDFADSVMNSLPPNAIIFTKGDLPAASLRYKEYCENIRTDLTLVEQELMSYDWYIPKMRQHLPRVVLPGDRWFNTTGTTIDGLQVFNMHTLISENMKLGKELFVCIGMQTRDDSWTKGYALFPYGVCHQIVSSGDQWVEIRSPYTSNWTTEYKTYDPSTWEHIANEEMWNSKINKALFLWSEAQKASVTEEQFSMYYRAIYNIYHDIFSTHSSVPAYFHKNLALASERLSRIEDQPNQRRDYLKLAVQHFSIYIRAGENDPQMSDIKQAVVELSELLESIPTTDNKL